MIQEIGIESIVSLRPLRLKTSVADFVRDPVWLLAASKYKRKSLDKAAASRRTPRNRPELSSLFSIFSLNVYNRYRLLFWRIR